MTKLTNNEYVERKGLVCPHCLSNDIQCTLHNLEIEEGMLYQNVLCFTCGEEWTEKYQLALVGYTS